MNILQALELLYAGYRVRRSDWRKGRYLYYLHVKQEICSSKNKYWRPTQEDIIEEDWEVFE